MDLSAPLFVDTNKVYQMDEAKFPGLKDSAYALERALIVESDLSWTLDRKNAYVSEEYTPSVTCDAVNQELYNLKDSLNVEDTLLTPVELDDNILDLPDIQLELLQEEMSTENKKYCQLGDLYEEIPNSYSFSIDGCNYNDVVNFPRCGANQEMPSCRFTGIKERSKRKRHPSCTIQGDIIVSNELEQCVYSKRRKLDLPDFCLTSYSMDKCLDNNIVERSLETSLYPGNEHISVFHFCDSPFMMNPDRQW